jgi:tRNA-specific 2-thiouridylase
MKTKKVLAGISGGAASAVAAAMLKSQGLEVTGAFLSGIPEFLNNHCATKDSLERAKQICQKLGLPFLEINVQDLFESEIIDFYIHEKVQIRHVNPCLNCHKKVKAGVLLKKAKELGFESVCTGHFAQVYVEATTGVAHLLRATDLKNDQSIYLAGLKQEDLQKLVLPLGGLSLKIIEKMVERFQLGLTINSTDYSVCMKNASGWIELFESRVAPSLRPHGPVKEADGTTIGEHEGLYRYNLGQSENLPKLAREDKKDLVITMLDAIQRVVQVGYEKELFFKRYLLNNITLLQPFEAMHAVRFKVQFGIGGPECFAQLMSYENGRVLLTCDAPLKAIEPGVTVFFSQDNEYVGTGVVQTVLT